MLKWLSGLMGTAEVRRMAEGELGQDAGRLPGDAVGRGNISPISAHDPGAAGTHALDEGMIAMQEYTLSAAYAESMAQGNSKVYSIVYAAAYGIGCSIIGASEQWARAYARACAHAIAAGAPIRFVSAYGHAVADGASPEDAFVFARRYAA